MINRQDDKFSFFVPATLEKGKSSDGSEQMLIRGIANSESAQDSDGEILEPMGFDYDPLLRTGFFNWDHQGKKTSSAIVGEPTLAKVINKGRDFYVEGFLYPGLDEARHIYKLGEVLQKYSKTRRLGFSIEGQVIERGCGPEFLDKAQTIRNTDFDPKKWARVKKARITGIAITPCPKNPNTYLEIVKGEYSKPLMEVEYDEEIIKAMEVDQDLTQHDPSPEIKVKDSCTTCPKCDHDQYCNGKCLECGYEAVGNSVKKSEIYNLIANRYTTDVEKAKEIFQLINSVNKKLFPMSTNVSKEAIQKAFEFLDSATSAIEKSNTSETTIEKSEETETFAPDNEEKAVELSKSFEGDLSKGQVADKLIEAGYNEDVAFKVASSYKKVEAPKEEDKTIEKSKEVATLEVKEDPSVELIKSLSGSIDKKFGALGTLLKSTLEQNQIIKSQLDELSQTNATLTERLNKIESTPQPVKSVRTVGHAERFVKSHSDEEMEGKDVYDLNKSEDVSRLTDYMFAEALSAKENGRQNEYGFLEKAISSLEIAKQLPQEILPWARSKNIVIKAVAR